MDAYSYSSMSLFDRCPLAFEYRYLRGEEEAFTTIEQHLGQSVHDAVETAYAARSRGAEMSADDLLECFRQVWTAVDLPGLRIVRRNLTAERYYLDGVAMLAAFHERVFRSDPLETLCLEQRFCLDLPAGDGAVFAFSGVIDRLARRPDGCLRVTDYKSGRSVPDPAADLQLQAYALHVLQRYGAEQVELCYEDLRAARTIAFLFPGSRARLVERLLVDKIEAIEKATRFPARPSALCGWCGFNPLCPDGSLSGRRRRRRG